MKRENEGVEVREKMWVWGKRKNEIGNNKISN